VKRIGLILLAILLMAFPLYSQNAPIPNTRIAFASYRGGNHEIYIMNADGSNQTNLTSDPANDEYPSWSPDGKRIAYSSMKKLNTDVYIINADGSGRIRLTDNPAFEAFPSWSPDGKKIAFTSERDGNVDIYIMNADGSNQTRLTDNPAADVKPQWSPDGKKIAFQTTRHGKMDIYVMSSDGSNETRLTNSPATDICLSWSPDGRKIAFASQRDGNSELFYGNSEIYIMNADGSNQTRLTNNPSFDMAPSWSPDGKKIAFYSLRNDVPPEKDERQWWYEMNAEIYVMNVDGSEQKNITNNPAYDGYPSWSPLLLDVE
jgi:Tol biopolymer transport system component